jgi:hypothetical protein
MPRHHGEKGAKKRRRDEQWGEHQGAWSASSWTASTWTAGAWQWDTERAGPHFADGVADLAHGESPTRAVEEAFTDDDGDRLWGDARVLLTGLLSRRVARLEAMLRERPECQVLAFEVSREMVESLVPRLLDLLAEKNGNRRP